LAVDPMRRYQSAAQMAFDLGHPGQVTLTVRAHKLTRDSWLTVFDRWRVMRKIRRFSTPDSVAA